MRLLLEHAGLTLEAEALGEGPPVLLLHGFPDHEGTFAHQLLALAAAGYRAVAPRMRGYSPSSIPADGDFHVASIAEDIHAWAEKLGAPVHLVGHDWGAGIAHVAAVSAPHLFRSLTMIAVPHPARFAEVVAADAAQQARLAYQLELIAPDAADRFLAGNLERLVEICRDFSPGWHMSAADRQAIREVLFAPGVLDSALAYYRQALVPDADATARALPLVTAAVPLPTLGIVGADDGCISADVFVASMDARYYPAGVELAVVPAAGHFVQREQPEAVSRLLIDFLSRH